MNLKKIHPWRTNEEKQQQIRDSETRRWKKKKDFEIHPNFLRPTFFEVLFYVPNAVGLF